MAIYFLKVLSSLAKIGNVKSTFYRPQSEARAHAMHSEEEKIKTTLIYLQMKDKWAGKQVHVLMFDYHLVHREKTAL